MTLNLFWPMERLCREENALRAGVGACERELSCRSSLVTEATLTKPLSWIFSITLLAKLSTAREGMEGKLESVITLRELPARFSSARWVRWAKASVGTLLSRLSPRLRLTRLEEQPAKARISTSLILLLSKFNSFNNLSGLNTLLSRVSRKL